jgi:hypothetical protein
MKKTKKPNYLPDDIARNLPDYMRVCGYAEGTINMRMGVRYRQKTKLLVFPCGEDMLFN